MSPKTTFATEAHGKTRTRSYAPHNSPSHPLGAEPDEYDGGGLAIEGRFGAQAIKLVAGDMVLYPSSSLHQVTPVTRGARIASFFWVQSMVRDDYRCEFLFDLDQSVQDLTSELGGTHALVIRLSGLYHNLLHQWAET